MADPSPPTPIPVPWLVTARGRTVVSTPCQLAFDAVADVAPQLGHPHFSECDVQMVDEAEVSK